MTTMASAVRRVARAQLPKRWQNLRQLRWSVEERQSRGVWSDEIENEDGAIPRTAHWTKFEVPQFDYTARRYEKSIVVGIDLGTSNSCVSYLDPDSEMPIVCPIEGKKTTPTVIGLTAGSERYFGHEAHAMQRDTPNLSMCSGKRLLGKMLYDRRVPRHVYDDVVELTQTEQGIGVRIEQTDGDVKGVMGWDNTQRKVMVFPVVHIIGMFMRYLKVKTEESLGMNVTGCCISVPAHFSKAQRKATEDAAVVAGMDVLEIIDEPSAAALAYAKLVAGTKFQAQQKGRVMVFDLGGGTFDLAVLDLDFDSQLSKVVASGGDDLLGGDDFDRVLIDYWKKELDEVEYDEDMSGSAFSHMRAEAVKAKIALDQQEEYTGFVRLVRGVRIIKHPMSITRFEYEELVGPLLNRLGDCCEAILKKAGIDIESIDDVLLVGEMTRTPAILKYIERKFGKTPVFSDIATPGTVVSVGTILRAQQLLARRDGKEVNDKFVYDYRSTQYQKTLSTAGLAMYRLREWNEERKQRKSENVEETRLRLQWEAGLPDDAIEDMTREVIEMEVWMRKQQMLKSLCKEAVDLLSEVAIWKNPRQGFVDPVLNELCEVLKFWTRVCEQNKRGEEQLAQALWEVQFYFNELSGSSPKSELEELAQDPDIQERLNAADRPTPVRTATGGGDAPRDDGADDAKPSGPTPVRSFQA